MLTLDLLSAPPRTPRGHSGFVSAHTSLAAKILEPHRVPTAPPIPANELRFAGIQAAAKYRFTVLGETPRAVAISLSLSPCDRSSRARAGLPLRVPAFRPS